MFVNKKTVVEGERHFQRISLLSLQNVKVYRYLSQPLSSHVANNYYE